MNKEFKPDAIVFEGGGVLGISYVGVLEILDKYRMLENVKYVSGTSAGSMAALLVALGYRIDEIKDIFWNTDFEKFMDSRFGFIRDILAVIGNKMGWNRGKELTKWVKDVIKKATGNPETTFRMLSERSDGLYLVVPATDLTRGRTIYFSPEYTPDTPLWVAIRASMSIPFYFEPVRVGKTLLVDGGLSHNYPINVFDDEEFMTDPVKDSIKYKNRNINLRTIGFSIRTPEENRISVEGMKIKTGKDKMKAIMNFMLQQANRIHFSDIDFARTVILNIPDIPWTKFDLSDEEKKALIDAGKECTLHRLEGPLPELYNSLIKKNAI